jgi:ATP-dependent RNA helicase DeaD
LSTSNPSRRRAPRGNPTRSNSSKSGGAASSGPRQKIEPLHPTDVPPDIHSFREWALGDAVQDAIAAMQITVPSPIQKLAIGPVLEGRDVIAKAETGTGKTLAFGAPMMAKIDPARASVLGLVLCPTRELAEQVAKVLAKLGEPRNIKVALIVGGEPLGPQVAALKAGSQVVVGTPGRVLDLYNQKFLSFPWTEFAVLDEADVMLEIGFIDDVKMILSFTPDERQTLLFSATFPPELLKLARAYTKNPAEVATAAGVATVDTIEQSWMKVDDEDRPLALMRLIEQSEPSDVFLVFCDRRTDVDRLMRRLERMPFSVKALHGGYDQEARFRVMSAFRTSEVKALVATDVASRGLDVAHVTHVINFGSPRDITAYTHRIGRTGRAGRQGRAVTFVTRPGMVRWKRILEDANWDIAEVQPPGPSRGPSRGPRRDEPSARPPIRSEREAAPAARPARDERETARETRPARNERGPAREARPARAERDVRPARVENDAAREPRAPRRREEAVREPRPERDRPQAAPTERREPAPAERREPRRDRAPRERAERPRETPPPREVPRDDVLPPVREPLRESEVLAERERLRERRERPHAGHGPRAAQTSESRTRSEERPRGAPARDTRPSRSEPSHARPPERERPKSPEQRDAPPARRDAPPARREAPPARREAPTARRDAAPERRDVRPERRDAPPARRDAPPESRSAPAQPARGADRGGSDRVRSDRPRPEPKDARPANRGESRPAKEPAREHKPRPHRGDRSDFGQGL